MGGCCRHSTRVSSAVTLEVLFWSWTSQMKTKTSDETSMFHIRNINIRHTLTAQNRFHPGEYGHSAITWKTKACAIHSAHTHSSHPNGWHSSHPRGPNPSAN